MSTYDIKFKEKGNTGRETPASSPEDLAKIVIKVTYTDQKSFNAGKTAL